jgi:hypothetical protein
MKEPEVKLGYAWPAEQLSLVEVKISKGLHILTISFLWLVGKVHLGECFDDAEGVVLALVASTSRPALLTSRQLLFTNPLDTTIPTTDFSDFHDETNGPKEATISTAEEKN